MTKTDKNYITEKISWEDFKNRHIENKSENVFYRGQANEAYPLKTTLARYLHCDQKYCSNNYHEKILSIAKENPQLKKTLENVPPKFLFINNFMYPPDNNQEKVYEKQAYSTVTLMMHMRHYGIPSPLLDWSKNPYIAAFFAFSDVTQDKDPAIFVLEKNRIKSDSIIVSSSVSGEVKIFLIDHSEYINERLNSSVLSRHVHQESAYTICYSNGQADYDPSHIFFEALEHNEYIVKEKIGKDEVQYLLKKYVFNKVEKKIVLKELFDQGINHKKIYDNEFSYEDEALKNFFF